MLQSCIDWLAQLEHGEMVVVNLRPDARMQRSLSALFTRGYSGCSHANCGGFRCVGTSRPGTGTEVQRRMLSPAGLHVPGHWRKCAKEIADVARGNGLAVVAYRRRGRHLDDLEHRHAEEGCACLATATGTDQGTYDHTCKPGIHGCVTQSEDVRDTMPKTGHKKAERFMWRKSNGWYDHPRLISLATHLDTCRGRCPKRFCQAVIQQAISAGITYHRSAIREGLLVWTDLPGAGHDVFPGLPQLYRPLGARYAAGASRWTSVPNRSVMYVRRRCSRRGVVSPTA